MIPKKFRAWVDCGGERSKPKMVKVSVVDSDGKIGYKNSRGSMAYLEPIVLMQFIDRLDKKGKEVYEEDIIKLSCGCCIYKVEYQKEKLGFVLVDDGHSQIHNKDIDVWSCEMEVIGNTCENPKLFGG